MRNIISEEKFLALPGSDQYRLYADLHQICFEYSKLVKELINLASVTREIPAPDTRQQKIDLLGIPLQS
jgi:hypothetical protein